MITSHSGREGQEEEGATQTDQTTCAGEAVGAAKD